MSAHNIQLFSGSVEIPDDLRVVSLTVEDGLVELGANGAFANVGYVMNNPGGSNAAVYYDKISDQLRIVHTDFGGKEGPNTVTIKNEDITMNVSGNVEALYYHGDGSELTGLSSTLQDVTTNGASSDRKLTLTNATGIQASGNVLVTGNVTSGEFHGDAGWLSNVQIPLEEVIMNGNTTSNIVEFSNALAFVTTGNAGIQNVAPLGDLSIGANVVFDDVGSNVLTVRGNINCDVITIGSLVLGETGHTEGLQQITDTGNTTTNTVEFNNASTAFKTLKKAGIGIAQPSSDAMLHVDGHVRLGGPADTPDNEEMKVRAAGALNIIANHSNTDNTTSNLVMKAGEINAASITLAGAVTDDDRQRIVFKTRETEALTIDQFGNANFVSNVIVGTGAKFVGDGSALTGINAGGEWTVSNSNIYYEANVAIGTNSVTSGARLEVKGPLRVSNASSSSHCDLFSTAPSGGWTTRETYNNWQSDEYGQQVVISADGTTAVVGSPFDDSGGYTNAGRAYVYLFGSNGYWQKVCTLSASDLSSYPALAQKGIYMQHSGRNVDVTDDGSVIIVGAPQAYFSSNNKRSGAVYVYVRPSGGWGNPNSPSTRNQHARLRLVNGADNDQWLGHSCAISGDGSMIVSGIPGYTIPNYADNYTDPRAGIVVGFMRSVNSNNQWGGTNSPSIQSEYTIFMPNPHVHYVAGARNWAYGFSVAINYDASIVVIGAPGYEDANKSTTSYGTAYVHVRPSSGWPTHSSNPWANTHNSGIKLTTGTTWWEYDQMYLGSSVAMDQYGDTIIVGAPFQNYTYPSPPSGVAAGPRVFIYTKPTASGGWGSLYRWNSTHAPSGSIQASDMDTSSSVETGRFGRAIDMAKDGSAIVVGAPHDDTSAGNNSGSLYVYEKPVGALGWGQGSTIITTHAAKLLPTSRHSADDEFGISVSISNYLTSGTHANKYVIVGGSHKDDVTSSTPNSGAAWFWMGIPVVAHALNVSAGIASSGDITATGTIASTSDERLKADIEKIQNALDKIELLNGYTYTMKDTRTRRYTGLIAQEVLPVLPEVVCGSDESNYALAYGNMMGLVVEAIKEMREQIRNIEARL